MDLGDSGTSFNDIDGRIVRKFACCGLLFIKTVLWETARFLRLFRDSVFVIGCESTVWGPLQLLTECVEGEDERMPFPLSLPRDEREWA